MALRSYTQDLHKELIKYLKANKKEKGESFPIIYISPEFFNSLYAENPLELDTSLGKYCMTFDKHSIVIKKKLSNSNNQIQII